MMLPKMRLSLPLSLVLILLVVTCHANPFAVHGSKASRPLMQTKAAPQLYTLERTIGTMPAWVPTGVAVDGDGYVYAIDGKTSSIRKLAPGATGDAVARTWGTEGTGNGQFLDARAIGIDSMAYVYVLDADRHNIQKFTRQGVYLRQWKFQGDVADMAVSPSGLVYVLTYDGNVNMYGPNGNYRGQFHHNGNNPQDLALDASSNVYITDSGNGGIYKYSSAGAFISQIVNNQSYSDLFYDAKIAISGSKIYIAGNKGGPGENMVTTFSLAGVAGPTYVPFGGSDGAMIDCHGITTDDGGNIYLADLIQARVQKFSAVGVFSKKWGYAGTANGLFRGPIGATLDSAGNIYVLDCFNQRVQKFSGTGTYVSQFGSQGMGNGQFLMPVGITTGPSNSIYVADLMGNRVQKFVAGAYNSQFGTPGAGNGQFQGAGGLAVASSGNIYVADMGNHRVQYFTSAGTYAGQFGAAALHNPWGLAISGSTVCVTDGDLTKVMKFGLTGTAAGSFGSQGDLYGQFSDVKGISADSAGKLWVSDTRVDQIQQFTLAGAVQNAISPASVEHPHPGQPMGVYAAASGKIYITDIVYQQVYVMAPAASSAAATKVAVSSLTAAGTGNGAQITFALSAPAAVDIEVDNMAGRPVRFISGGVCTQGLNTALWDDRNTSGAKVPAGTYLVRLTARSGNGQQANSVARLSLAR